MIGTEIHCVASEGPGSPTSDPGHLPPPLTDPVADGGGQGMQQLPGVDIDFHEGRVVGLIDLRSHEMQEVLYNGRIVLVLVADVGSVMISDTKGGDTKARWTFKTVDAALVRSPELKRHLASCLCLDGVDESSLLPKGEVLLPKGEVYEENASYLSEKDATSTPIYDQPALTGKIPVLSSDGIQTPPPYKTYGEVSVTVRDLTVDDDVLANFLQEEVSRGVR